MIREWTPARRRTAAVAAWAVATALVVVCARGIDWRAAAKAVLAARPSWVVVAVVANAAVLPCMALFWTALRPPSEPAVSFTRMLEIVATSTAVMNTVPFGAGHATAVMLLVRRAATSTKGALAVLAFDQLGEGIAKVSLLVVAALCAPIPSWMRAGAITMAGGVSALFLGLAIASRWARELRPLMPRRRAGSALAWVAGTKIAEGAAIACVQLALGVQPTFAGTVLVLAAVVLGTIVPIAPGNLGTYEASAFLAYKHLGVSAETAFGLAIVQHLCFIVPSVGAGYLLISAQTFRSATASQ